MLGDCLNGAGKVFFAELHDDDVTWVTKYNDWVREFYGVLVTAGAAVAAVLSASAVERNVAVSAANIGAAINIHFVCPSCVLCSYYTPSCGVCQYVFWLCVLRVCFTTYDGTAPLCSVRNTVLDLWATLLFPCLCAPSICSTTRYVAHALGTLLWQWYYLTIQHEGIVFVLDIHSHRVDTGRTCHSLVLVHFL